MDHRMQDDDDQQIGRILSRREALALLAAGAVLLPACKSGGSGTSAQSGTSTTAGLSPSTTVPVTSAPTTLATGTAVAAPTCVVKPALTEGPYFVDEKLNRSDIRLDPSNNSTKPGALLKVNFRVSRVGTSGACTALTGATVDVWHCDAGGLYSDVSTNQTVGQKFLRGYQTTDANGAAGFTTIYPGSYQGRAVHIHLMIRSGGQTFTSQLFFDDNFTDQIYAQSPYRSGSRTLNAQDSIFRDAKNLLTLDVKPDGSGYAATFDIGMSF
jgi:protocatechuate 3,4-dioxygenase beta subunit